MKLYIVKGKYNGNKSLNKDSSKELVIFKNKWTFWSWKIRNINLQIQEILSPESDKYKKIHI